MRLAHLCERRWARCSSLERWAAIKAILPRVSLLVAALTSAPACAPTILPARLYTDDGRILEWKFEYSRDGRGAVWGQLADGENFRGEYFTVTNRDSSSSIFQTPWGVIRGESVSRTGPQITQVTAVGDRGTQIKCISFPRGEHGAGSCKDSRGHDYSLHH